MAGPGNTNRFLWIASLVAAIFVIPALALAGWMIGYSHTSELRREAIKLLLQFFLITGFGGVVAILLNSFRDDVKAENERLAKDRDTARKEAAERKAARRQAEREQEAQNQLKLAALREFDNSLSKSYREFKLLKRQLRAACFDCARDGEEVYPPYSFSAPLFREKMDQLLDAQIRLECLRDDLRARTDLIEKKHLKRIRRRLKYAARYYHDVFEDFERGRIASDGDVFRVTESSPNMVDFLASGNRCLDACGPEARAMIASYFEDLKCKKMTRSQQHDRLDAINDQRKDEPGKRRFRAIADDCFAIASSDLRVEMKRIAGSVLDEDDEAGITNRSYATDHTE